MAQATARSSTVASRLKPAGKPFLGLLDAVTIDSSPDFSFDGAITVAELTAAWQWVTRDLAADLIDAEAIVNAPEGVRALDALMPEILSRARKALAATEVDAETNRRTRAQLGDDGWNKISVVLTALRCRGLFDKAQSFGRAANTMQDEATLGQALQAMPLQDVPVVSLLMFAMVGQVSTPTRLTTAAIRNAGAATEQALRRAGYAPLIEAFLAHSQNQIPSLAQRGTFGDVDLICRGVDRFHRLMRAITAYVELDRGGRWASVAGGLTKAVSERIEPRLRDVPADLNMALRRREGSDRVDGDQILAALNGMYLLATIRDSRDSLAVNATFDKVWSQTGEALEIHVERNLEYLRRNPADTVSSARLDAALKMAEVRFNMDYAETMRRAKEAIVRR